MGSSSRIYDVLKEKGSTEGYVYVRRDAVCLWRYEEYELNIVDMSLRNNTRIKN
jgi:hypothetical protein